MSLGGLDDFSPQRLAVLRDKANLDIDAVAVGVGVNLGTARNWEAGRSTPTPASAALLARILGVRIPDLTTADQDNPTLVHLRQWKGWSGDEAAERAGITRTIIWTAKRYVTGPTQETIEALAQAYEVTAEELDAAWQRGRRLRFGSLAE
jgi:transcriptional regulator with XRE-family HTH domain